jgi:hypothetical protein
MVGIDCYSITFNHSPASSKANEKLGLLADWPKPRDTRIGRVAKIADTDVVSGSAMAN